MALIRMSSVEEEMKKTPELKQSDLDALREWLRKQPHLPAMSDSELVLFLHSNYYRAEPTKAAIDAFFTFRTHVPEIFANRDPLNSKELREIMKVMSILPLPSTTPEGYKIFFTNLLDFDSSRYVPLQGLKLSIMAMELCLYSSGTVPGYILILDSKGFGLGHIARWSPMMLKKILCYVQEAIPLRLKAVHCTSTPPAVDVLLNMAKPFMKKELMNTVFLHSRLDTLAKKIPIDLLPTDVYEGGKAGRLEDLWAAEVRNLEEHRAWFQEENTRKANEALRPTKAKRTVNLSGVGGSFKKLDID